MRRILALVLVFLMIFGMVACGGPAESGTESDSATESVSEGTETDPSTESDIGTETESETQKETQKETDEETEAMTPVVTPSLGVYKTESFETADEKFSQYSTSNYASLTDSANEYKMGGQFDNGALKAGAKTGKAHSGNKALVFTGFAPNSSGAYGARAKLNNLVPEDLTQYIGSTLKISAYAMVDGVAGKDASTGTVSLRWGIMGDRVTTEIQSNAYTVTPGQWVLMEFDCEITPELLNTDLGKIEGKHYPLRPFVGFGSVSAYPTTVYIDDITVTFSKDTSLKLPSIFADNMVVQRGKPVSVWGWGGAYGDTVTVTLGKYSASGKVNAKEEFLVELPAMEASFSETLTVSCNGNKKVFKNVGIGEVWYCSGQSNMQLSVGSIHNAESIIADANNRDIRSFKLSISSTYEGQKDVKNGTWKKINTSNVKSVSAIAYVTAWNLQKELNVPIAVIESFNGGSAASAWLSRENVFAEDKAVLYNDRSALPTVKEFGGSDKGIGDGVLRNNYGLEGRTIIEDYNYYWDIGGAEEGKLQACKYGGYSNRFAPTGLYNGMQYPLKNYAMAGVMWYQGESRLNSMMPEQYNYILYDLIEQWREDFCDDHLPIVIFQLAPYSDYYNEIRQTQLDTAKRMDNVFAITTAYEGAVFSTPTGGVCLDLDRSMSNGWGNAIHPGTKIPVAERAAYTLLTNVYGKASKYAAYCNPEYQSITVKGNVATLTFSNADGLKIRAGDSKLTGFRAYTAAGAELTIESAVIKDNTVVITTKKGTVPDTITYAFDVSSTKREISYESLAKKDGFAKQYITVMTGNLENGKSQPAIPFLASRSKTVIHDAVVSDGKVAIEIRELGHTKSTHKIVVEMRKGTAKLSSTEYSATFNTVDSYMISQAVASGATGVKISLYDGDMVIETKTVEIK